MSRQRTLKRFCATSHSRPFGRVPSEPRSALIEHTGVANVSRLSKALSAIGLVGFLAFSSAGCSGSTGEPDGTLEPGQSIVEVEETVVVEQDLASPEVTPGVLAMMVVNAALGDAEPLAEYGTLPAVEDAAAVAQEVYANTVDEIIGVPPTEEQVDAVNAAIADAFGRVEVTVLEEEVDGDQGRAVVAIRGIDLGEGTKLAKQDPEAEALMSTNPDEALDLMLLRGWELSPLVEEPHEVEFSFVLDPKTGKWEARSLTEYKEATFSAYAAFMGQ